MTKRYSVKRGQPGTAEYDVQIYDGDTLIFGGSFFPMTVRDLTENECAVIDAIRAGVEALNEGKKDE